MKRPLEPALFFGLLAAVLALIFRHELGPGHSLELAIIEDPAARYSFYPWDVLSVRQLQAGHFPLWNPYSGLGAPHLANLQSSIFSIFKWPFFFFPALRVLDHAVLARLALGGTFAFALARKLGLSRAAAAAAGFSLALGGYWLKHFNVVNVASEVWTPLLLWLLVSARSRRSFGLTAISALIWFQALVGGNPEAAFYLVLIGFGFALVLGLGRPGLAQWMAGGFFAPLLLGGILASAQLLPFVEYLGAGWHVHDPRLHLVAAHDPRTIWSLISPWLAGTAAFGAAERLKTMAPHLGAAVLVLALIGAAGPARRRREVLFFAGTAAFLLAIVYKLPPLGLVSWLPPFDRSGNVKFAMADVSLCAALLAGFGVDAIGRGAAAGKKSALPLAAAAVALVGGGLYARMTLGALSKPWLVLTLLFIAALAMVLVAAGDRWARGVPGPRPRPKLAVLALVLLVLELVFLAGGFAKDSAIVPAWFRVDRPEPPAALVPIIATANHSRFLGLHGALHPNFNLLHDLADLRAFDGLYPARYVAAMAELEGFDPDRAVDYFLTHGHAFHVSPERLLGPSRDLLDRMAVKYVVVDQRRDPDFTRPAGFELAGDGGGDEYQTWVNLRALPRVLLARGPGPADAPDSGSVGLIADYGWDRVTIDRAEGPGKLVLADLYFPGWRAEVNGAPARLDPDRGWFRGLTLPPGLAKVVMTYRPVGFRIGLGMSLAAGACLLGLMVARRFRE